MAQCDIKFTILTLDLISKFLFDHPPHLPL